MGGKRAHKFVRWCGREKAAGGETGGGKTNAGEKGRRIALIV
jgi:hypothetical protein